MNTAYLDTRKCEPCLRREFKRAQSIRARITEMEDEYRRGATPGQRKARR